MNGSFGCHFFHLQICCDRFLMAAISSAISSADKPLSDRPVFWGLLLLLVWAPLPLASANTWSMDILIAWSQFLLLGTAYAWRHAAPEAFARLSRFRWPLGLLGAFCALQWFQLVPLPAAMLAFLSPETLAVQDGVADLQLSLDPQQTRIYAALSFAYFSCFLVSTVVIRDAARLDKLAQVLVYSGLLQALVGVVLFSLGARYPLFFFDVVHANVLGTYGNRNHFAGYMEICLSIGIGLMLSRLGSGRDWRWRGNWKQRLQAAFEFMLSPKMRLRMILVIMVIGLVLTRSRMGNAGFFAAMLIVGVISIILSRKLAPATVMLIASLVIVDVVIVGTWVGLEKVVQRVQQTGMTEAEGLKSESVEARQSAAKHALDLVNDFPVFGTGAGSFYGTYSRYRTDRPGYWDHTHNDYVEMAADYGLLGVGILGAFVLLTLAKGVQILRKRRSSLARGMAFGVLMAVVALIIHSTVDFNLQLPANALTLVVVMSMAWIAAELPSGATASPEKKRRRRHRSPPQGVAL